MKAGGVDAGFGIAGADLPGDDIGCCVDREVDRDRQFGEINSIALDERNPLRRDKMTEADRWWMEKSLSLDWSHLDAPDPYWLNRIVWYSIHKDTRPYPARPGEEPGMARLDDDD